MLNFYESKAYIQGLFSIPYNVLSKACMVRVRLYAPDTRLLPVSHRVSTLCFPFAFFTYPPSSPVIAFVFHHLCDMENHAPS